MAIRIDLTGAPPPPEKRPQRREHRNDNRRIRDREAHLDVGHVPPLGNPDGDVPTPYACVVERVIPPERLGRRMVMTHEPQRRQPYAQG